MKMRAGVTCRYAETSSARAVAAALSPDNLRVPKGILISTKARGARVVTEVRLDGRIETLLATLEDLLACTSTAESVL